MDIGRFGIWRVHRHGTEGVRELESLGFTTLWLGGSPGVADARPFLEASGSLVVATGILNVWRHDPAAVAAARAELAGEFPDRFLLGIGIGHPEATSEYTKPLTTMRRFFDGLDAAAPPVPREQRIAAALGPKMLDLAAERSLGTHPYFTPVEHTRVARERLGPDAIVAPELTCVVEPDPETARRHAREWAARYLGTRNYRASLSRLGFTEDDLDDGGSDRLIDATIAHGAAERIAERVREHLDAGADHVCLQPVGHGAVPLDDYRALSRALL